MRIISPHFGEEGKKSKKLHYSRKSMDDTRELQTGAERIKKVGNRTRRIKGFDWQEISN